jgi:hydrogenase expression/formation protein HypD
MGSNVEIVYSAMDAVEVAKNNPNKNVVFLGIGFETTTPGTAIAIKEALRYDLNNFYVFSLHKLVQPVLRTLLSMEDLNIDGFICPGHVAVILGEEGFEFLPEEYKKPSVIAGFENMDIVTAIYCLAKQIKEGRAELENFYVRAVSKEGNKKAKETIFKYFETCDDIWRGIGSIAGSGLKIRDEYEKIDAAKRFSLSYELSNEKTSCRCGEIIKGKASPVECPAFSKACTPENPLGPCMVSSEGACAAYYKYQLL